MNLFDRICAMPAFLFGVLLLLFAPGLAVTRGDPLMRLCLAAMCLMAGWGIVRCVWIAWRASIDGPVEEHSTPSPQHLSASSWAIADDAKRMLDRNLSGEHDEQR